jgi:hypothetical protein
MMMKRFLFVFLMVVFAAGSLGAQMRRPRVVSTGEPGTWVSGSVAGVSSIGDTPGVNDGRTASTWDFGRSTNWQYRASLERTVGTGGSSFGISGSYANIPFVYSANLLTPIPADVSGTRCGSCDAHLEMATVVATFHVGAGQGFHQVIELNGGIVTYQNLKRDSDKAKLAGGGNIDPLFSIGYGIGYGFSDRTQIEFVPDYAIAIHERSGLSNGVSNTNSMRSFRFGIRKGFGSRTVRR